MTGTESPSEVSASYVLGALLALPLSVNLWKVVARGYLLSELWRHLLLDVAVVALLAMVLAFDPLERPWVYGPLYLYFCVSFLLAHPPAGPAEWFGSLVALAMAGRFFPHLHHLTGFVAVGLLLAYLGVIRLALPEMSRGEVLEVLATDDPSRVAAECLDTALGYERFFLGLEKLRYFLLPGPGYRERVAALEALHARVTAEQARQGISFVDFSPWRGVVRRPEPGADPAQVIVRFPAATLEGRRIERDEAGVERRCAVRVQEAEATLRRLEGGGLRVVALPAELGLALVEEPAVP